LPQQPARSSAIALASLVSDCRVAVVDDSQVADAIFAFMGIDAEQAVPSSAPSQDARSTTTILFTDLVDHTVMMQRLGDEAGRAVLREHERITREVLSQHGGTEVKTDGDSFMAAFSSATAAVACAVDLQRAFAARNASADEPIVIRAGLNVGEPIEEGGDYFGSAVILAARIKDQAGAGEILVPEALRHLLSGKNFVYADHGEMLLKGFEDPVRLHEVRWRA
jgi:class 3 adenylate cyclase